LVRAAKNWLKCAWSYLHAWLWGATVLGTLCSNRLISVQKSSSNWNKVAQLSDSSSYTKNLTHTRTCTETRAHTHTHTHAHTRTHAHTHTRIHAHTHTYPESPLSKFPRLNSCEEVWEVFDNWDKMRIAARSSYVGKANSHFYQQFTRSNKIRSPAKSLGQDSQKNLLRFPEHCYPCIHKV